MGSDIQSAIERSRGRMRIAKLLVGGAVGVTLVRVIPLRTTRVVVKGDSMTPALESGDRLLVRRTNRPLAGQIVALRDPREPARVLVKRVASLTDDGVVVLGDNPSASTDSRTFGAVSRLDIIGVALYRYAPLGRSARVVRGPVPSTQWPPTGSTPSSPPTISKA
jgi:nickel-type superoxide dismutase maturation protease